VRTKLAQRAFSVAVPTVYNPLPVKLTLSHSIDIFKRHPKDSSLFNAVVCPPWSICAAQYRATKATKGEGKRMKRSIPSSENLGTGVSSVTSLHERGSQGESDISGAATGHISDVYLKIVYVFTFGAILTLAPRLQYFVCVLCIAASASPATTKVQDASNAGTLGIANRRI